MQCLEHWNIKINPGQEQLISPTSCPGIGFDIICKAGPEWWHIRKDKEVWKVAEVIKLPKPVPFQEGSKTDHHIIGSIQEHLLIIGRRHEKLPGDVRDTPASTQ